MRILNCCSALLLITALGYATHTSAQTFERKGNVVTYRGNKFLYSPQGKKDTIRVTDPITNKKIVKVEEVESRPIKMNADKIYNGDELSMLPLPNGKEGDAERSILKGLQIDLDKLPDGKYYLDLFNVILDKRGKICFYEYKGLLSHNNKVKIPADIAKSIDSKIDSLVMRIPGYKPGRRDDVGNVVSNTGIYMSFYTINVKKHKATFGKK